MSNTPRTGLAAIGSEFRALDKIPERARSFSVWDQAALWFGAASLPAAWLYGGIMAGWTCPCGALLLLLLLSPPGPPPSGALRVIAARASRAVRADLRTPLRIT